MTGPHISVASLLRREGRGPHMVDRPLAPRARERIPAYPPRRHVSKIAAVVAALFALGSVIGTAGLRETYRSPLESDSPGDDLRPSGDVRARDAGWASDSWLGGGGAGGSLSRLSLATVASALPEFTSVTAETPDTTMPPASGASISRMAFAEDTAETEASEPVPATPPQPGGTPLVAGLLSSGSDVGEVRAPVSLGSGAAGGVSAEVSPAKTALPDVEVPGVEVPGVAATPDVEVSGPDVSLPAASATITPDQSVRLKTSNAAVRTPAVAVTAATAGPVALSKTEVALPDVEITGARVALPLSADAERPALGIPAVAVSEARLRLPNLTLGKSGKGEAATTVETPDVTLPRVDTADVLGVVTGLLGGK